MLDKRLKPALCLSLFVCLFVECPEVEAAMDVSSAEPLDTEVLYDCVICGQSGPSTEDRPTGLVVLLQASSGAQITHTFYLFSYFGWGFSSKFKHFHQQVKDFIASLQAHPAAQPNAVIASIKQHLSLGALHHYF